MATPTYPSVLTICLTAIVAAAAVVAETNNADAILKRSGVTGGLVTLLGRDGGELAVALGENGEFRVQHFTPDAKGVAAARKLFRDKGLSHRVSAHHLAEKRLPYAEEMVNLLVVSDGLSIPRVELERVLVPGGVLFNVRNGTTWTRPVPSELDDWAHWQHDAGKSGVSRDTRVGPPRRMKWVAGPRYCRGHEYATSVGALISTGGRIFTVVDEGQTGNYELPSRCVLICRDAFNGLELWRKPVPHWYPKYARGGFGYLFQPERMATDGEHLFLPTGQNRVLTILDATTGETIKTLPDITGVQQVLAANGILAVESSIPDPSKDYGILALKVSSWSMLWYKTFPDLVPVGDKALTNAGLTFDGERVYLQRGDRLYALDAKTGAEIWTFPLGEIKRLYSWQLRGRKQLPAVLRASEGKLLVSAGKRFYALDPETGRTLWETDQMDGWYWDQFSFFAIGDTLYNTRDWSRRDLVTGDSLPKLDPSSVFSRGHHPRCYPPKATTKYLITNNRGAEFISLDGNDMSANDYLRGNCGLGVVPANGLLYIPSNQCFCYGGVMQPGFKAMAPAGEEETSALPPDDPGRLLKGTAYSQPVPVHHAGSSHDWPMYRHDPARLGSSATAVPDTIQQAWEFDEDGKVTPPVVADGLVLFANKDTCEVIALDAVNGTEKWRFTAASTVDSPPTVHAGLVLFGCADGHVHCLRAADGQLAWKFLAAPRRRWIQSYGQIESAWPVSGSVLVKDGIAYAAAGRNSWIDGGIHAYGLDPETGEVVHYQHLKDKCGASPEKGGGHPYLSSFHCEGTRNDLLVADVARKRLYLGVLELSNNLKVQPNRYDDGTWEKMTAMDLRDAPFVASEPFAGLKPGESTYTRERRKGAMGNKKLSGARVVATGGFLDDALFNRTYWMFADIWPGYYKANFAAKSGHLLVADDSQTYAAKMHNRANARMHSPTFVPAGKGVLLYADANSSNPVLDQRTWGKDKRFGYSRMAPPLWHHWIPVLVNSMVGTRARLFVAGAPDVLPENDPYAAYEGRAGAVLQVYDKKSGGKLNEIKLPAPPVFDGLIAADGRLYMSGGDGRVRCFGRAER